MKFFRPEGPKKPTKEQLLSKLGRFDPDKATAFTADKGRTDSSPSVEEIFKASGQLAEQSTDFFVLEKLKARVKALKGKQNK